MFFTNVISSKNSKKPYLKNLEEASLVAKTRIRERLNEVDKIDNQLRVMVTETRNLSLSIQEKLSTKLKITRSVIDSIANYVHDGVILVNHAGDIIRVNSTCKKIFGYKKEELVGNSLSDLMYNLEAIKENGEVFNPTPDFFKALTENLFYRIDCDHECEVCNLPHCLDNIASYFKGVNPQSDILLTINHKTLGKKKILFSFSVLSNEPKVCEEVTYIIFFKLLD